MLLKVLDQDHVKILMEDHDVDFYDLPFEKLDYDDPTSKAFLYDLIQKTYNQTGVNFLDSRLMIEVIPGVSRSYYVLLTRISSDGSEKVAFDKADPAELEMYLFRFEQSNDVLKFFQELKIHRPTRSDLYYFRKKYYAALSFSSHTVNEPDFSVFLDHLSEYGERCSFHYVNEATLREWGEYLLGPTAHEVLMEQSN